MTLPRYNGKSNVSGQGEPHHVHPDNSRSSNRRHLDLGAVMHRKVIVNLTEQSILLGIIKGVAIFSDDIEVIQQASIVKAITFANTEVASSVVEAFSPEWLNRNELQITDIETTYELATVSDFAKAGMGHMTQLMMMNLEPPTKSIH